MRWNRCQRRWPASEYEPEVIFQCALEAGHRGNHYVMRETGKRYTDDEILTAEEPAALRIAARKP
jgi:hypothetical protein